LTVIVANAVQAELKLNALNIHQPRDTSVLLAGFDG
jgi:hypothetical protein